MRHWHPHDFQKHLSHIFSLCFAPTDLRDYQAAGLREAISAAWHVED